MNALVKQELKRRGPNGGKLSPPPPAGPRPKEETANRSAVSKGKSGMDTERTERAADALRALTRAREITMDRELMKDVHRHAAEHVLSITEALSGAVTKGGKGRR